MMWSPCGCLPEHSVCDKMALTEVITMTMREIRALTGLSQVKFAERYQIPMRTIQNWEMEGAQSRKAPPYVLRMLERIVKEDLSENKGL